MKKEFTPKVSIIIPVYNGANYIGQAINSALSQTYKNIEIIVVDDGSEDDTEKIVNSYGTSVKYYKKENGGVSTALNFGIKKMTGDYFSWLSHDDLYEEDKILNQVEEIVSYGEKAIVFSDYVVVDENGVLIKKIIIDHKKIAECYEKSVLNGVINGITLLIPSQAFNDCGEFKPELKCTQDYDMWYRMLLNGYHFYHISKVLAKSREHSNQTTNTSPVMIKEGNELWINIINSYPVVDKKRISGSEFDFYREMAYFLNLHPYQAAKNYCIEQCMKINKKEAQNLKKELNKNRIKKNHNPLYLMKKGLTLLVRKGLKQTMRTVKKFILRS